MDIMTAIAAATNAVDLLKSLNQVDKEYDKAELKAKIAELLSNVADLKIALIEANDDLRASSDEIRRLQAGFALREDTIRYKEFLYAKGTDGNPVGYPYCQRCEQVDGFMIKVVDREGQHGNMVCPRCKTTYVHVGVWRPAAG
jgi:hypothetical protein